MIRLVCTGKHKFIVSFLLCFVIGGISGIAAKTVSEPDSLFLKVFFRQNVTRLDLSYHGNESNLNGFSADIRQALADSSCRIQNILIRASASPEGAFDRNVELSRKRGEALKNYLQNEFGLSDDVISVKVVGEDWESLYCAVSNKDIPDKEEVMDILERHRDYIFGERISVIGGPKKELMDLNGGSTWFWLLDNIYPDLRNVGNSVVCRFVHIASDSPATPEKEIEELVEVEKADTLAIVPETVAAEEILKAQCRLGTNLLYDAATIANLSLELGFGRNFAFNVLATYSPWDIRSDIKLRTLLVQPELRYYFADNFRGHYLGIEGHFGWYNAAFGGKERYQDRDGDTPLWGAGLSYGYVLPFSRHWGMDFSFSAGYARLVYDCFYNIEDGARFTTRIMDWWGPTRLGISIYYQF